MHSKNYSGLQMSEFLAEREIEIERREKRKKSTIAQLRKELSNNDIGYMANWTKPVLIRRLEENDKWIDYQNNQKDSFQSFRDQKARLEEVSSRLLKEMELLNDKKNAIARERAKVLEDIKKIDAVIEMTEPTF
tara:strand:- start:511 stop:912 length:402 start_codon:yes stop_codon:yes gene_type:complete